MGENLDVEGRLAVRTPMQWDDGPNGGFSTAPRRRLTRPQPTGPVVAGARQRARPAPGPGLPVVVHAHAHPSLPADAADRLVRRSRCSTTTSRRCSPTSAAVRRLAPAGRPQPRRRRRDGDPRARSGARGVRAARRARRPRGPAARRRRPGRGAGRRPPRPVAAGAARPASRPTPDLGTRTTAPDPVACGLVGTSHPTGTVVPDTGSDRRHTQHQRSRRPCRPRGAGNDPIAQSDTTRRPSPRKPGEGVPCERQRGRPARDGVRRGPPRLTRRGPRTPRPGRRPGDGPAAQPRG